MISNVEEDPAFQHLTQFLAAFLFSRFVCPDTLEARNLAKIGSVFNLLIVSVLHRFVDILIEHDLVHSFSIKKPIVRAIMSSIAHALVGCKISALSSSYLQMSGNSQGCLHRPRWGSLLASERDFFPYSGKRKD